ncbi:glucose/arabinose dehydrogenase [Haloactinopolyspora alba]|uniref:Glucose/arabinose dehydrogenase n=1 Tax=Haloactinopolyspora alba TaxID=648780 RepID=A0A2P8DV15_9ACTN|nr:ThuA domain-containing protein [Haloactinopolyspora alba]PSL01079.1 glucose/arabinose dehydrogenase [Haloactinopolyspora alba]
MIRPTLTGALVAALAVAVPSTIGQPPATAQEPVPQHEAGFDALVFSKTTNFYHESIPAGVAAIESLGEEHGFNVVVSDDSTMFTDETLAEFEVVIFNNTNSTPQAGNLLGGDQRAAFERYIQAGGGFVGIHSASGTERDWPWYGELVGAFFASHPAVQELEVEVDDPQHPSTAHLPQEWTRTAEPYDFATNPRGDVHVLASYDSKSYEGDQMGADHPISWCQRYDGGRSWYTGMGHASSAFTDEPLFLDHLLGGIEWAAGAAEGDCGATAGANFEKIQLDGNTDDPLAMDIDDRGRVFYVQRGGALKYYDPQTSRTHRAATFDVLVEHTHGMHGIVLDPDFTENHWLYVYYSPLNKDVSLVSRFTFDEQTGTLDMDSEKVLFEINSQRDVNAHEGGGMDFDADGNLYVATGDNSLPCCSGYGATDERPGHEHSDAQRSSANTNDLRGKVLRVHPTDTVAGGYTIPEGNLFEPGTPRTRPEIYVMGLRNPYRIHVDNETGWLYWGDVGPDARNDSDTRGSKGYDEYNQAREAGFFGWPYCIGDNHAYNDHDFATGESGPLYDCAGGPVNDSPNNTGAQQLPPAQPAWMSYPYGVSPQYPELGSGGRLAIGGPTYHFDPELDSEAKFPEYYDDTVFVAEWTRNAIFEVKLDENGDPAVINPFLPGKEFLRPIDMQFGPDGSMYVIEWGSNYGGSGRGDPNTDSGIYKINYAKIGERSPDARASATPTSGQPPLTVQFSSDASGDPDEHPISYAWDFDADGTVDSTDPNPVHTYTERGDYTAQLTVTDPTGRTGVSNVPITVGNTAPVVEMVEPRDGQVFGFGEPIDFDVRVTDAEDGSSEDGTIDCQQVVTQPRLGHDEHGHPLERYRGCAGTVEAIVDEGHDEHDNIFYIVDTTYTDQGGTGASALTGGDSAILQPRLKQAEHWTGAGDVALYDTQEGDGGRMVGQIGHRDWISFEPVNLHGVTQLTFRVASSGSGGTIELRTDAVDGPVIGSVDVAPTGGSRTFETVTAQVDDPGGTHELFLVFTDEPGQEYLFNLDWMRFENPATDPLREVGGLAGDLRDTTAAHAGALDDEQESYLGDLAGRVEAAAEAALDVADTSGTDDPAFTEHVDEAFTHVAGGRRWITGQVDAGELTDEVATDLLTPVTAAHDVLSGAVAELYGLDATLETDAAEVVAGEPVLANATLSNDGNRPVRDPGLALEVPEGWDAERVGASDLRVLEPGAAVTGRWRLTPPATAEPAEVELAGTASFVHRGRSPATLPLTAELDVLAAVEVSGMDVGTPVFSGRANTATVSVTNNRSAQAAEVDVTVDVPADWSASTGSVTVPAGSTRQVDVTVSPPAGAPAAGEVATPRLTARVTADGTAVAGAPESTTYVVPHGDDVAIALDGGSAGSPVLDSYTGLASGDEWDPERGFGWVSGPPQERDRGHPDALRRDFVLDNSGPGELRVAVPPGEHVFSLLTGDPDYSTSGFVVSADGSVVSPARATMPEDTYAWKEFTLDGGASGRTVDLTLSSPDGSYWRMLALVARAR